ncbi:MAG: transcriptional regulator [Candidatus Nomurabacteria bacterium]|nr:transcriptional regulator [Candidatus Nomurabacteria bacterium]
MIRSGEMTERQKAILFAVIEQYAEIAVPVGSVMLAKLFNVSSATVRAEMARLEELGLLTTLHTSSGRVPTDAGYRLYVNALADGSTRQDEEDFSRATHALTSRVEGQGRADTAIQQAAETLAELTGNLGLATIDGRLYMAGLGTLFAQPEFVAAERTQAVARLLDNIEPWLREAEPNEPVNIYIGQENPIGRSSEASLIISRFRSPFSDKTYIGVLGPTRQSYSRVIYLVQAAGKTLEQQFF